MLKRTIALLLSVLMVCTVGSAIAMADTENPAAMKKISSELSTVLEKADNNSLIAVYLWMPNIDIEAVDKMLDQGMPIGGFNTMDQVDLYLSNRRQIVQKLTTEQNAKSFATLGIPEDRIILSNTGIPVYLVRLYPEEIYRIIQLPAVVRLDWLDEEERAVPEIVVSKDVAWNGFVISPAIYEWHFSRGDGLYAWYSGYDATVALHILKVAVGKREIKDTVERITFDANKDGIYDSADALLALKVAVKRASHISFDIGDVELPQEVKDQLAAEFQRQVDFENYWRSRGGAIPEAE